MLGALRRCACGARAPARAWGALGAPRRALSKRQTAREALAAAQAAAAAGGPALPPPLKAGDPIPVKIKKDGAEPVALPDEEYPEWLWTVAETKTLDAIVAELEDVTVENVHEFSMQDLRRAKKLLRRAKMKEKNRKAASGV